LKIENSILKHYLKNVYFITSTAYAGKSTMEKCLQTNMIWLDDPPKMVHRSRTNL